MCGILIYHSNKITISLEKNFIKSLKYMKNRGPDETLIYKNKKCLIGFNRLSINNISNGSQPFESKCGKYILVFNGEIFNYKDLERELNKKGIKTDNASEIEIIFNYYKLYGSNCVKFFKGFFAIIIFDRYKNSFFSSVDRLGIKQIYYYHSRIDNLLILTSDYSHLIKYPIFNLEINRTSLMNFFCLGRTFGGETLFKNVFDLNPGFTLRYSKKNGIKIKRYWHNFSSSNLKKDSKENLNSVFNKIYLSSNKLWKKSELQISNTLSTGTDSNLINYGFSKNKISNKKFSILEGTKNAKNKPRDINQEKINVILIFKELNKFIDKNKNPFVLANASSTALFQLYKSIKKKNIRVSFTGEGGDEIFGGYERYKKQLILLKYKKMNFDNHLIELYKREIKLFAKLNNFISPIHVKVNLKRIISSVSLNSKDLVNKILEFDQITWLPMLLRKHDVIGMHYNIEVRPQLLDHELVNYINEIIPSDLKFNTKNNKIFLKRFLLKYAKLKIKKKIGTPSIIDGILRKKKYLKNIKKSLKESFFIKKYFKKNIFKDNDIFKKNNSIFLWRLYLIGSMFQGKKF